MCFPCIPNFGLITQRGTECACARSAFRDSRFNPLEENEIPTLEIGISLLVKYEKGTNCLDWEVGTHGIIIEFRVDGQQYSATYLPEVAAEQGACVELVATYVLFSSQCVVIVALVEFRVEPARSDRLARPQSRLSRSHQHLLAELDRSDEIPELQM